MQQDPSVPELYEGQLAPPALDAPAAAVELDQQPEHSEMTMDQIPKKV